jgi:hypothetical protein
MGFQPEESLIILGIKSEEITIAMRFDLQAIDSEEIITHLKRWESDTALVLTYSKENNGNEINDEILRALSSTEINVKESLLVTGDLWRSTICQDESCCPAQGKPLPDINSSVIAAEQVLHGHPMPFASRDELQQSLRSSSGDEVLIESVRLQIELMDEIDYRKDPKPLQQEGARAIQRLIELSSNQEKIVDPSLIASALVRLRDLQVRDFALGCITESNLIATIDLWRWIVRIAPKRYVAPAATLLAAAAYERGDGALAQSALDRALETDEEYPLAHLLKRVFAAGWPPETFATMRTELHPKIHSAIFEDVA